MSTPLAQAADAIARADYVALACHVEPDGDALGSMLALHHLCQAVGRSSIASWPEPFMVAPHYTYLPGLDLCTKPVDFPQAPDVMVTFDCGSIGRLNELAGSARQAKTLIVLDHHKTNTRYGHINVIEPGAAATAVVVRTLVDLLGWPLTRDAALCLYTGLVTDTGRFQYEATTPEVFQLAAELAAFDLPITSMSRQLFEEHRFEYLKLVAACLDRAVLDRELGLISTWITVADLNAHGVAIQETEGLIDLLRRAQEAEVACVLKETPHGVRVSLRATHTVDVGEIAAAFGGGGHAFASGWTAEGSIDETLGDVRAAVADMRRRA